MAETLRVLISSTAIDLTDYRKAVEDAILRLDHLPIGMEHFGAIARPPLEVCREKVMGSDAVVVMVAHRYGWVPSEDQGGDGQKSITWHEVQIALDEGIPVLAYLVDPKHPWSLPKEQDLLVNADTQEKMIQIGKNVQALKEFQVFLKSGAGLTCDFFTSPDSLAKKVVAGLAKIQSRGDRDTDIEHLVMTASDLLDLSSRNLKELPIAIRTLTHLRRLHLNGNQLTHLPDWIGDFRKLTQLWIHDNQLTELPATIGELYELEGLRLDGNQLNHLPNSIGKLDKLTQLWIQGNQLRRLPDSIGALKQLTWLRLDENQLTQLPNSIGELENLTQLWIQSNQLRRLPAAIGKFKKLTKLLLHDNQFTRLPVAIRRRRVTTWIDWLRGVGYGELVELLPQPELVVPQLSVRALRLRNVGPFADTRRIMLARKGKPGDRIHLFLGVNSAGKSTLLRCIALASLGPTLANDVENRPEDLVRRGAKQASIEVQFELEIDPGENCEASGTFTVGLEMRQNETSFRAMPAEDMKLDNANAAPRLDVLRRSANDRFGLICAYGALRSIKGDTLAILSETPRPAVERVRSLFRADASLMDSDVLGRMLVGDLSNLREAPKSKLPDGVRNKMVRSLQSVLPGVGELGATDETRIEIHNVHVPIRALSDGYSGILGLIGHVFRHALEASDWDGDPTALPGILLIDEVDLHLHPSWQRVVLRDLRRVFPRMQILATSHAPMVAASVPAKSLVLLRRVGKRIHLTTNVPEVTGWRADQILTSVLFDLPTSRDVETERLLKRYARLLREHGPQDEDVQTLGAKVTKVMQIEGGGTVDTATHDLLAEILRTRFATLDEETRTLVLAKAGLMVSDTETSGD